VNIPRSVQSFRLGVPVSVWRRKWEEVGGTHSDPAKKRDSSEKIRLQKARLPVYGAAMHTAQV